MTPAPSRLSVVDAMSYEAATFGGIACKCERCGYSWHAQHRYRQKPPDWKPEDDLPKRCAKCRSKYWNKPRRKLCGFASDSPYVKNPSLVRRAAIEAERAAREAEWQARRDAIAAEQKRRDKWRRQKRRWRRAQRRARRKARPAVKPSAARRAGAVRTSRAARPAARARLTGSQAGRPRR